MYLSTLELKDKYIRKELTPTMFCSGCGNGQVLSCVLRAIEDLGIEKEKLVFVSGIGCSSRLPMYINAYGVHTTHGRAIPFATGVKVTNPDLHVIVFTGDGDLGAIGLHHFLHAIRRNIDITIICINNENYGMTGGQLSPTTPRGHLSATSLYENFERPFDLALLARSIGAPYVARWTSMHTRQLKTSIEKGLCNSGLAFIEVLSSCPTNKKEIGTPVDYLRYLLSRAVQVNENPIDSISHSDDTIHIGELCNFHKPNYHELLEKKRLEAQNGFWEEV
jgi:2-oxoglutarate ferredoxin oxidoreductase subunit beta